MRFFRILIQAILYLGLVIVAALVLDSIVNRISRHEDEWASRSAKMEQRAGNPKGE